LVNNNDDKVIVPQHSGPATIQGEIIQGLGHRYQSWRTKADFDDHGGWFILPVQKNLLPFQRVLLKNDEIA